jgi:flagellar protein FlgJ
MLDITSLGPMSAQSVGKSGKDAVVSALSKQQQLKNGDKESPALREAFDSFVGETFYGQMLSSMRKTVGKSPYFHGGRAEEVFQGQLDQQMGQQMAKASASTFTGPMFELFNLNRK